MVSVIITTFNRRDFLRQAVESVLMQGYKDKEIIVVDDGSQDASIEIVKDLPIKYIYKENGGISSARNTGILNSKGTYIAFLDSDDLWLNGKLEVQMKEMLEADCQVSYTDEIWVRNGKRVNPGKRHRKYSGYIFERCLPLCIISPSSVVIRRDIFSDVGLFDETLPVCEDYDMWLRITWKYPVLFINKPLILKRGGHADQLSKRYEAMDRFRIQSLFKVLENLPLSSDQTLKALTELERKCAIYIKGAQKRGKIDEISVLRSRLLDLKESLRRRGLLLDPPEERQRRCGIDEIYASADEEEAEEKPKVRLFS